jgi:hypothetical protein
MDLVTHEYHEKSERTCQNCQDTCRYTGEHEPGTHAWWPLAVTDTLEEDTMYEERERARQQVHQRQAPHEGRRIEEEHQEHEARRSRIEHA